MPNASRLAIGFFASVCGCAQAQFFTVVNLPDDPYAPSPRVVEPNTQVNIFAGGKLGQSFEIGPPAQTTSYTEVNVLGGELGRYSTINDGAVVNISEGRIDFELDVASGGTLNIFGGRVCAEQSNTYYGLTLERDAKLNIRGGVLGAGAIFRSPSPGTIIRPVTIYGNEFRRNGVPTTEFSPPYSAHTVFTAVLEDGSQLMLAGDGIYGEGFSYWLGDEIGSGTITLVPTAIPPADLTPIVADSGTIAQQSLRPGQHLTLTGTAETPYSFTAVDATISIEGGRVEAGLETHNTTIAMSDGSIGLTSRLYGGSRLVMTGGVATHCYLFGGSEIELWEGELQSTIGIYSSTLTIEGGEVNAQCIIGSGSNLYLRGGAIWSDLLNYGRVEISGGNTGYDFRTTLHSQVVVTGGLLGTSFRAEQWADVHISGGAIANLIYFDDDATLTLVADELELNGTPITQFDRPFVLGDTLTGTLADGTTIMQGGPNRTVSFPEESTILPAGLLPPNPSPQLFEAGDDPPRGVRTGETVTVREGVTLHEHFVVNRGTLIVEGAAVERYLAALRSTLTFTSGQIGNFVKATEGTIITQTGGTVGRVDLYDSEYYMSGGETNYVEIHTGSMQLSGGELEQLRTHTGIDFEFTGGAINIIRDNYYNETGEPNTIRISGGEITGYLQAKANTHVVVENGVVDQIYLNPGSTGEIKGGVIRAMGSSGSYNWVISGGTLTELLESGSNALLEVVGGEIAGTLHVKRRGNVELSGGSVADALRVENDGTLHLYIHNATLDGIPIDIIGNDLPNPLEAREGILAGTLLDGSPFQFTLSTDPATEHSFVDPAATVTLRTILPPCTVDLNADGFVDMADIGLFVSRFISQHPEADLNEDGFVDLGDITSYVEAFLAGC